ncbi:MAG: hypothetical protein N3B16_03595 [Candidatus Aminicenantes bacterium]|nr:hypothetical protein [Candidatus Aminicenantes bacterium]
MKRTDWKCLIHTFLFICPVVIAFTGFLIGLIISRGSIVPEDSQYFPSLHRYNWKNIRLYFPLALSILVITYLILNWGWIKSNLEGWSFDLTLFVIAPILKERFDQSKKKVPLPCSR